MGEIALFVQETKWCIAIKSKILEDNAKKCLNILKRMTWIQILVGQNANAWKTRAIKDYFYQLVIEYIMIKDKRLRWVGEGWFMPQRYKRFCYKPIEKRKILKSFPW